MRMEYEFNDYNFYDNNYNRNTWGSVKITTTNATNDGTPIWTTGDFGEFIQIGSVPPPQIIPIPVSRRKCEHCGQYGERWTQCEHCGAPIE